MDQDDRHLDLVVWLERTDAGPWFGVAAILSCWAIVIGVILAVYG